MSPPMFERRGPARLAGAPPTANPAEFLRGVSKPASDFINRLSRPAVEFIGLPYIWHDPPLNGRLRSQLSIDELTAIMPSLAKDKDSLAYANDVLLPGLNAAMAEGHIDTPAREAAFLATLAVESGELTELNEKWDGDDPRVYFDNKYNGVNGNHATGDDGYNFRGRGYIQLTGRDNYTAAGKYLDLDLVNNPDLAAQPANAFRIAAWYWTLGAGQDLNTYADKDDFWDATVGVNGIDPKTGQPDGWVQRQQYYRTAKSVLGYAGGGAVGGGGEVKGPGSSIGDQVPAFLSDGEFVVNTVSANANRPLLTAINDDPMYMNKYLQRLEQTVTAALTRVRAIPNGGADHVDQSMTVRVSGYDVHEAFAKAKLWEQRRALTEA